MRSILLALLLVALGCTEQRAPVGARSSAEPRPAAPAPAPAGESPPVVAVATFNINFGNVDLADTVRVIRAADADIVLLQETNAASARFLERALADDYSHFYFHPPDGRYSASGFGFLSRTALADLRYIRPRHGLFGAWLATTRVHGVDLALVNLHLAPIRVGSGAGFGALVQAVTAMEAVHEKEIEQFAGAVDADAPAIVAGDLNSTSMHVAATFLRARGFTDTFAEAVDDADTHRTWRWPVRGRELGLRIDFVFRSAHFRTTGSRIIKAGSSDHHLVTSVLRMAATQP